MTTTSPATRPEAAPHEPARPLWWGAVDGLVAGLLTVGLATLAAALLTAVGQHERGRADERRGAVLVADVAELSEEQLEVGAVTAAAGPPGAEDSR